MNNVEVLVGVGIGALATAVGALWTHLLHLRADRIRRERDEEQRQRERARPPIDSSAQAETLRGTLRPRAESQDGRIAALRRSSDDRPQAQMEEDLLARAQNVERVIDLIAQRLDDVLVKFRGRFSQTAERGTRQGGTSR